MEFKKDLRTRHKCKHSMVQDELCYLDLDTLKCLPVWRPHDCIPSHFILAFPFTL